MTISMQGCIGSPEYEASREFNAFSSSYEANGYNGDALHQPLGDWGEAHRGVYLGLYTETLVNKFLEISENMLSSRGTVYTKAPGIQAFVRSSAAMAF